MRIPCVSHNFSIYNGEICTLCTRIISISSVRSSFAIWTPFEKLYFPSFLHRTHYACGHPCFSLESSIPPNTIYSSTNQRNTIHQNYFNQSHLNSTWKSPFSFGPPSHPLLVPLAPLMVTPPRILSARPFLSRLLLGGSQEVVETERIFFFLFLELHGSVATRAAVGAGELTVRHESKMGKLDLETEQTEQRVRKRIAYRRNTRFNSTIHYTESSYLYSTDQIFMNLFKL